jgi:hypothetical protein
MVMGFELHACGPSGKPEWRICRWAPVKTLTSDARYDPAPLRERSEVTYDRLRDAAIGGAIAGPAGAVAAGAIGN